MNRCQILLKRKVLLIGVGLFVVLPTSVFAAVTPTVLSTGASEITGTFAKLGFAIPSHGDSSMSVQGVQYATAEYFDSNGSTYDQSKQSAALFPDADGSGGDMYVYSLSCGTTYHYRAFATNSTGTGYGSDTTFTTGDCPMADPVVTLNTPAAGATTTSWSPSVTWENATTCAYSYDNATFTDVNCASAGTDVPAPSAGTVNLYLRAINNVGIEGDLWATLTYNPPPVAGWNSQPTQVSSSDSTIRIDAYINDTNGDTASYAVEYSLDGGSTWNDAGHLSGGSFPISGNAITEIPTYGGGPSQRSNVAFYWNFTQDQSTASTTTGAKIRLTPSDASSSGEAIVSDTFSLRAPPAPPVFAGSSGSITDINENSVIVHYSLSSVGSGQVHDFALYYASDAYYTAHETYTENTPVTYTGAFADDGATNVTGLTCGTTYHFVQTFTNTDNQTATSSDATFTTSDCTGGGDSGGGGEPFTSGDGSSESPWVIDSCTQFATVNSHLSSHFLLALDLDCTATGNDIMIGGVLSNVFTGDFDGGGHMLTVHISDSENYGLGLFRTVFGGSIHDLSLSGASTISGKDVVGSIVGIALDATLTRVSSAATVTASNPGYGTYPLIGTGGLVGSLYGGAIYGSQFTGVAASPFIVGGIAGFAANDFAEGPGALISRSSTSATILGQISAGGIAGYLMGGARVRNSFASSTTAYYPDFGYSTPGSGGFGGLVGLMIDGTVSRSYAVGVVAADATAESFASGGLVGAVQGTAGRILDSFSAALVQTGGAPVGAVVGEFMESDTPFAQLFNNYFDTSRVGLSDCLAVANEASAACNAVDGSASGYWRGTSGTPLSTWNNSTVWDFSNTAEEFPTLRAYAGAESAESDEFIEEETPGIYTITASAGAHGSISPTGSISVTDGDDQTITVEPATGYSISSLVVDGVSVATSTSYTFSSVAADHSIVATFSVSSVSVSHARAPKRTKFIFPTTSTQALLTGIKTAFATLLAQYDTQQEPVTRASNTLSRDLLLGSKGDDVRQLQGILIAQGYAIPAGATGYFGAQTKQAISAFQREHHITPSVGYFGPLTRGVISGLHLSSI